MQPQPKAAFIPPVAPTLSSALAAKTQQQATAEPRRCSLAAVEPFLVKSPFSEKIFSEIFAKSSNGSASRAKVDAVRKARRVRGGLEAPAWLAFSEKRDFQLTDERTS